MDQSFINMAKSNYIIVSVIDYIIRANAAKGGVSAGKIVKSVSGFGREMPLVPEYSGSN